MVCRKTTRLLRRVRLLRRFRYVCPAVCKRGSDKNLSLTLLLSRNPATNIDAKMVARAAFARRALCLPAGQG